jgi:hypothetical protein
MSSRWTRRRLLLAFAVIVGATWIAVSWPTTNLRAERPIEVTVECPWEEFGDTLSITEHGPRVLEMQTRLNWAMDQIGAPRIDVDGCFDAATRRAVERFQQWKGLTVDGRYGPCTRAVMVGGPGCGTFHERTVDPPSSQVENPASSTTTTTTTTVPARPVTKCRGAAGARFVICVDADSRVGSVRSVSNGRAGNIVLGPFEVTPSPDTRRGLWASGYTSERTPMLGLQWFVGFSGHQGVHAYHLVAPWFTSSGCVRVHPWTALQYWLIFRMAGIIDADGRLAQPGALVVHVYD